MVEDDKEIVQKVAQLCEVEMGYSLIAVCDGEEGLKKGLSVQFDLIILDVNLPNLSGLDICRQLRVRYPRVPMLFLTGRTDEIDRVLGLELGADDYVTKPFGTKELGARIRRLFSRQSAYATTDVKPNQMMFGSLKIDSEGHRVWKGKDLVALTRLEYDLLLFFASNPGRTFERQEIIESVLGYHSGNHDDTLTVHLARLRAKIEDNPSQPVLLKTVRGVGYRFAATDEISETV